MTRAAWPDRAAPAKGMASAQQPRPPVAGLIAQPAEPRLEGAALRDARREHAAETVTQYEDPFRVDSRRRSQQRQCRNRIVCHFVPGCEIFYRRRPRRKLFGPLLMNASPRNNSGFARAATIRRAARNARPASSEISSLPCRLYRWLARRCDPNPLMRREHFGSSRFESKIRNGQSSRYSPKPGVGDAAQVMPDRIIGASENRYRRNENSIWGVFITCINRNAINTLTACALLTAEGRAMALLKVAANSGERLPKVSSPLIFEN